MANRGYAEKVFAEQAGQQYGFFRDATSADEVFQHLELIDRLREELDFRQLNIDSVPFGTSYDDALPIATAVATRFRKRAGLRALKKKYGREGAADIICKKTGHRYNLQ